VITLLAPGPLKYSFVKEGIDYYLKGISKWIKVSAKFPKVKGFFLTKEARLKAEEEVLLKNVNERAFVILLDENGERVSTKGLSELLKRLLETQKEITFIVGGPEGVSEAIKRRAQMILRISDLTLNHEIALLVLAEALYRALSLLKGHPYHRA